MSAIDYLIYITQLECVVYTFITRARILEQVEIYRIVFKMAISTKPNPTIYRNLYENNALQNPPVHVDNCIPKYDMFGSEQVAIYRRLRIGLRYIVTCT